MTPHKNTTKKYYVLLDCGGIYGIGTSPQDAINDAIYSNPHFSKHYSIYTKDYPTYEEAGGQMFIAQIPLSVYKYIKSHNKSRDAFDYLKKWDFKKCNDQFKKEKKG